MLRQAVGPTKAPVGYREVKQPGYEFDHLVQRVKRSGATYTSSFPICLLGAERENFAFTFSFVFMYLQTVCVHFSDTVLCMTVQLNPVCVSQNNTSHRNWNFLCEVFSVGTLSSTILCHIFYFQFTVVEKLK